MRRHDVCFLITVRPTKPVGSKYLVSQSLPEQVEVVAVRGCEVEGMLGPDGKVIEEFGKKGVTDC